MDITAKETQQASKSKQRSPMIKAEKIDPTLRGVSRRLVASDDVLETCLILLSSGELHFENAEQDKLTYAAPMVWSFQNTDRSLVFFGPGSTGYIFTIPQTIADELVGRSAESTMLQELFEENGVFHPSLDHMLETYMMLARNIEREVNAGLTGSQIAIVAWIRLMLIALWRERSDDIHSKHNSQAKHNSVSEVEQLRAFRRLVELHFRHHLSIADYARLLEIGYDRLYSICQRKLGRTPLQLVHQRLLREAVMRLERTDESISAIAYACGFTDTNNFSRFFHKGMNQAPSRFRVAARMQKEVAEINATYADWP